VLTSVVIVAAVALAIAGTYLYRQYASAGAHRVFISQAAQADCKPAVDSYMKSHAGSGLSYNERSKSAIILDTAKAQGKQSIAVHPVPALTLNTGARRVVLRPATTYWLSFDGGDDTVAALERKLGSFYKEGRPTTLTAVGDIIPGRTVAKLMAQLGVSYPFTGIASTVKGADVVYGNLEAPLSDRVKPPYKGMAFIAPSTTVQGLKLLGVNIVSLANNHSTNFGLNALTDTMTNLRNTGIEYAGAGMNLAEARSPTIVVAGGTSFAFLDYNSIIGSLNATTTKPGVSWIRMKPWSRDSAEDATMVCDAVRQAKAQGHFVVACFHWSDEYKYAPSQSQRNMAHAACDAGADLVIGSHPHIMQPIEFYNGKLIAYSLGNFIFDQVDPAYTKQGVVMKCRYSGTALTALDLVPYVIQDWCRPVPATGAQGRAILDQLLKISGM